MAEAAHFLFLLYRFCNQAILAAKSFGSCLGLEALTRFDGGWRHHFRAPNRFKAPHVAFPGLKLSIDIIDFYFVKVFAENHYELVFNFLAGLAQKLVRDNALEIVNDFVIHIKG